jgi:hypothetical protein
LPPICWATAPITGSPRADRSRAGALIGAAAGVVAALVGRALGLNGRQGYHVGRELAMVGFYTRRWRRRGLV